MGLHLLTQPARTVQNNDTKKGEKFTSLLFVFYFRILCFLNSPPADSTL